jgi:hypothetical protein
VTTPSVGDDAIAAKKAKLSLASGEKENSTATEHNAAM